MDDLAERIRASVENPNNDLWFPGLAYELTTREWNRLHSDIGLTRDNYGTERLLRRNASASREIITSLKGSPLSDGPTISIEAVQQEFVESCGNIGVKFYTADEILNTSIPRCLEDALAIVNRVPSLMETVDSLVRSLHLIRPADPDSDVSFSQPDIPFSIFISVPEKRIENDVLRVAEAIVHEAMHLQLTLMERVTALASDGSKTYYSPWRKELRSAQGIIHALYVFKVVREFFELLRLTMSSSEHAAFTEERCDEIQSQIRGLQDFRDCCDLTILGVTLVERLL